MTDEYEEAMSVLVFGGKGYVGSILCRTFHQQRIRYILAESRAEDTGEVRKELERVRPTHVVSAIGRTFGMVDGKMCYSAVQYLSSNLDINLRHNLLCNVNLAKICDDLKIHFTYISTGCIFRHDRAELLDGTAVPFEETDTPNNTKNAYTVVKSMCDEICTSHYAQNTLVLRVRMVMDDTPHPKNFLTKFLHFEKVQSVPNSFSVAPSLFVYLKDLLKNKVMGPLNFVNPGLISPNEILQLYQEIVDPDFVYQNFTPEDSIESTDTFLCTRRLESLFPDIPCCKDAVRKCWKAYKLQLGSCTIQKTAFAGTR